MLILINLQADFAASFCITTLHIWGKYQTFNYIITHNLKKKSDFFRGAMIG